MATTNWAAHRKSVVAVPGCTVLCIMQHSVCSAAVLQCTGLRIDPGQWRGFSAHWPLLLDINGRWLQCSGSLLIVYMLRVFLLLQDLSSVQCSAGPSAGAGGEWSAEHLNYVTTINNTTQLLQTQPSAPPARPCNAAVGKNFNEWKIYYSAEFKISNTVLNMPFYDFWQHFVRRCSSQICCGGCSQ